MTRFLLFLIICTSVLSCTKNTSSFKGFDPSHAIINTTGVLHYENFPDGWGLYYETDSNQSLIFKDHPGSDSALYEKYRSFVNQRTKLSFQYLGETGCLYGFGRVCGIDVVNVVDLKSE
jgi:hypothetical protein